MAVGSWTLVEELFARGDPAFVDELRAVHAPERLGDFAARWIADPRPFSRQALQDYLSRPLNAYRHEPLVKRLFKLAEKANDDEIVGAFLVAFDRSVRRRRRWRSKWRSGTFVDEAAGERAGQAWEAEGFVITSIEKKWGGSVYVAAIREGEVVETPACTTMPRPKGPEAKRPQTVGDEQREKLERRRLFSVTTRRYLQRRAWRYFRQIGRTDAERYVNAVSGFLARYTDADTDSDIHLIDNWGLVHALFGTSPALVRKARTWHFAPGKSVADLAPAPRFERAWLDRPQALLDLVFAAQGRTVRMWAAVLLRLQFGEWLAGQPVEVLLRLADHPDARVSALGFELLENAPGLATIPVDEWMRRLEGGDYDRLRRLADLLMRRLDPARVATHDALRLAAYRSRPVAELGFRIVQTKSFGPDDVADLLQLTQAECETIRGDVAGWLRATLEAIGPVQSRWLIEFLDSRYSEVRAIGWTWLNESPARDDPTVWRALVESPYDDVRGPLIQSLEARTADPDAVRLLWATVLLNVARGGRHKPGVVRQLVDRMGHHPADSDRLLPLLAVAIRSSRGPEFRAGLAGVVTLVERHPNLRLKVQEAFPELDCR